MPQDRRLLRGASAIGRLNDLYCGKGAPVFFLLHRPRRWNPQEGVWMGRERKHGKLAELNRLLRSGRRGDFRVTPTERRNWRRSAT